MGQYFLSIKSFLVLALVAALLAAGCGDEASSNGGDSGEITVETSTLSKQEFIKSADAICTKATQEVQSIGEKYARERSTAPNEAELKSQVSDFILTGLVPTFEEQIDELSALGAPSGDEQQIKAMLKAQQKGLEDAKKDPTVFFRAPNKSLAKAAELGEAYGFAQCGRLN